MPWTPPSKALAESRVALLTTAGVSMKGEPPFDMQTERDKGDWGDPSWRAISADATSDDVVVNHLHIDTSYIEQDLNVALPLTRLHELAAAGIVGDVAPTHYSIMGFQGADPSHLENLSAPEIALSMKKDAVDLALLAPV
ncbi:MAG: glycine/sarcosine/betaine reductase selenoprotein B family protein [Pseudomonadota bacterium]